MSYVLISFIGIRYKPNRCSINILKPMTMRITPPRISAYFPSFPLRRLPNITAKKLMTNVVMPIKQTAVRIFTCKKAKLKPTPSASMLVAIAKIKMSLNAMVVVAVGQVDTTSLDSLIIPIPMKPNKKNAIQ